VWQTDVSSYFVSEILVEIITLSATLVAARLHIYDQKHMTY